MGIKAFYGLNPPTLEKISDAQWRQFRFVLPNKRFFKVPDAIRCSKDLQGWLVKKKPLDVYYTIGRFLSPETLGPKTNKVAENLFLGADLVFDIDKAPFSIQNVEKARLETLRLMNFLNGQKIAIKYVAFSGAKGFHIVCQDPFEYIEASPIERENRAKNYRIQLTEKIRAQEIEIDSKVTTDTRRILRLPGTINSKTGIECRILQPNEIQQYAIEIIKKSKRLNTSASSIRKEMTDKFHLLRKMLGFESMGSKIKPPYYYSSFLSSQVTGTRLHVPFVLFNTHQPKKAVLVLEKLQKEYCLNDFFLFAGDELFAIGLNALQKNRVNKILQKAKSKNRHFFKKYSKAFVPISPIVNEKMQVVQKAPQLVQTIASPYSFTSVSQSHLAFLQDCQITTQPFKKTIGKKQYILTHCLLEN